MKKQISKIVDGKREWATVEMTQAEIDAAQPAPSTDPRDYQLTLTQWRHMVRSAGLWAHIKEVVAQLEANDLAAYADVEEMLEGQSFKFDATLVQIASFAPLLPGVELPDETALSALWLEAAARQLNNQ